MTGAVGALPTVLLPAAKLPGEDRITGSDRCRVVRTDGDRLARAHGVAGMLCTITDPVDAAVLDAAGPSLRVVAVAGAGYDRVDVAECARRGVVVTNTPGVLAETTADLTFALLLAARRQLPAAEAALRAGEWTGFAMDGFLGLDVHGATLGVVGYGQIGRAVARRAAGFGMRCLHLERPSAPTDALSVAVDMDTLLRDSDVLCLCVPRTQDTAGLIGAAELARMKPTATLVNTARGGIVDEDALAAALTGNRLHSAGLDVYADEPLPAGSPLRAAPRVVLAPHIGSATWATRAAMVHLAADNVLSVLGGGPALTPVAGSVVTPPA